MIRSRAGHPDARIAKNPYAARKFLSLQGRRQGRRQVPPQESHVMQVLLRPRDGASTGFRPVSDHSPHLTSEFSLIPLAGRRSWVYLPDFMISGWNHMDPAIGPFRVLRSLALVAISGALVAACASSSTAGRSAVTTVRSTTTTSSTSVTAAATRETRAMRAPRVTRATTPPRRSTPASARPARASCTPTSSTVLRPDGPTPTATAASSSRIRTTSTASA